MRVTIHGINTCDTVKKARKWLDDNDVDHVFHDFRVDGLDQSVLAHWIDALGWESLLNRSSTSFRELPDAGKVDLNRDKAEALMLANPTLIKRPVLDADGTLFVGFKPEGYQRLLSRKG